jgi:ribosomal protein L11 methyltransferase
VILRFTSDVARVVKRGGSFIASGIIHQKKDLVKDALIDVGFEIAETIVMEDWVAIIAKRL